MRIGEPRRDSEGPRNLVDRFMRRSSGNRHRICAVCHEPTSFWPRPTRPRLAGGRIKRATSIGNRVPRRRHILGGSAPCSTFSSWIQEQNDCRHRRRRRDSPVAREIAESRRVLRSHVRQRRGIPRAIERPAHCAVVDMDLGGVGPGSCLPSAGRRRSSHHLHQWHGGRPGPPRAIAAGVHCAASKPFMPVELLDAIFRATQDTIPIP